MNYPDIAAYRLYNQQVISNDHTTPLEIVRHLGAMQAQDYHGSLWALGLRTGHTQTQIIEAVESRQIIRTWPQRGTLHFVAAEDAKWLVNLSQERMIRGSQRRRQQLELDDSVMKTSRHVLENALSGNRLLSRPAVMDTLEQAGISTKNGRGYHILWYLSQLGVTYIGPMEGKQQTVGLLDELIPSPREYSRDEAIAELTRRYFVSHGPAMIQDFMWWSGLTARDVRLGLEMNKKLLVAVSMNQQEYWLSKDSVPATVPQTALLLPGFDEYLLGYKDRTVALHLDHSGHIVPGGNGMFLSTIVIDGRVIGTWKRTLTKKSVFIHLSPFASLSTKDLRFIREAAEKYGHFHGLPVEIIVES